MRIRPVPLLVLVASCASPPLAVRSDGDLLNVTYKGAPFAVVHAAAEPRPFVFPILGPDGVAMTRSYPMAQVEGEATDHPHHVSAWFAHGDVDGFDFWQGKAHRERIVLAAPPDWQAAGERVAVRCQYRWLADDDTLVATEQREWVFGGDDAVRTIDVHVTLQPGPAPLVFGDTKEGMFALRMRPELSVEGRGATGHLSNSEGNRDGAVWGKRARWIDTTGIVDGREVGLAMFDHPDNYAHPTWWHARTYGLLAANPFGVHDFEKRAPGTGTHTVPVGSQLQLRYRVLLHGAAWDRARIEDAYSEWIRE